MKLFTVLLFSTGLFFTTGCVSTQSIVTGTKRAPVDSSVVQVFSVAPPGAVEIALVTASAEQGYSSAQSTADLCVKSLKQKAALLGANGIVILSSGMSSASSMEMGTFIPSTGLWLANSTTRRTTQIQAKAVYVE